MIDTYDTPTELAFVCLGIILNHLFSTKAGHVVAGRPALVDVLRMPDVAEQKLSALGVDSLSWMELLTMLETEFEIEIGNDFFADDHISPGILARALANGLNLRKTAVAFGEEEA